ncbi:hypothetical protein DBR17_18620 [Sphingomonas sp. HMWF008]|nr:hypothetical protein DBR17_18620 [Sphingomonas sp. HMWF008]
MTLSHSIVTACRPPCPVPATFCASSKSTPPARPERRAALIIGCARAPRPDRPVHIACASTQPRSRCSFAPASTIGHSAAGSPVASAACIAASNSLGV